MQDRPVIVKEGGGSSVAMFAILAVVVIVGVALFVWQPWNTSSARTTNVIVQPGAQGGASSSGGAGTNAGSASGGGSSGSSAGSTSGSGH